jgi:hypothetical protein
MLSKEVCNRCLLSLSEGLINVSDKGWAEGCILCSEGHSSNTKLWDWRTFQEAFARCPKRFEHAVAKSVNIDKEEKNA